MKLSDQAMHRIASNFKGRVAQDEAAGYRDYWAHVESLAEEIKEESHGDPDSAIEALSESVDSSRWVFVTWKALKTMEYCSNQEAWLDHGVELNMGSWGELITSAAYWALYDDVEKKLNEIMGEPEEALEE